MNVFSSNSPHAECEHCGLIHSTPCPRIRAVEYYQDGSVKRVEYHDGATKINWYRGEKYVNWDKKVSPPSVNLEQFIGGKK